MQVQNNIYKSPPYCTYVKSPSSTFNQMERSSAPHTAHSQEKSITLNNEERSSGAISQNVMQKARLTLTYPDFPRHGFSDQ